MDGGVSVVVTSGGYGLARSTSSFPGSVLYPDLSMVPWVPTDTKALKTWTFSTDLMGCTPPVKGFYELKKIIGTDGAYKSQAC